MNHSHDRPEESEVVLQPHDWAHGGHTVARTPEGRVVFVRHADVGETVRVRLTESDENAKFWRGDVVEVLEASPDRRDRHPWEPADALRAAALGRRPVGGAEFGHLGLERQREIKTGVLRDLLGGIGKFGPQELDQLAPRVEALPGEDPDGLGWRTRAHFAVDDDGAVGMHPHRSEDLVPVEGFPLMVPALERLELHRVNLTGVARVDLAAPDGGRTQQPPQLLLTQRSDSARGTVTSSAHGAEARDALIARLERDLLPHLVRVGPGTSVVLGPPEGRAGEHTVVAGQGHVVEHVDHHSWRVSAGGFWQIHRLAPGHLLEAVLRAAQPREGQFALDLYSGAGLFTAALAEAVGARGTTTGAVVGVEGSPVTSADAVLTFGDDDHVEVVRGGVEQVLARRWPGTVRSRGRRGSGGRHGRARTRPAAGSAVADGSRRPDVVVLDPPRAGAGKAVVDAIHALGPERVVYVSCDPATLARDLARFRHHGWAVESMRAFDLYPNTHHLESLVTLTR